MRLFLSLTAVAVAAITATADEPKKDDKMKKHELKVSFATGQSLLRMSKMMLHYSIS